MKKLLTIALCILMVLTATLVGCNNAATVKFGAGLYVSTPTTTDATEDNDGSGKVDVTVAAVTVDAEGKVVSCALDTADITVAYTADGKAIANDGFKTKAEQGDSYGMKAYGGSAKEWYEQSDAFNAATIGKTADEIASLMGADNYGSAELKNAGCTIQVSGLVKAASKIG